MLPRFQREAKTDWWEAEARELQEHARFMKKLKILLHAV